MNNNIKNVFARYILDSRANPTVEVEITLDDGSIGRAAVPSGASTGKLEAHELRDEAKEFHGKGVTKAVQNVNDAISDVIVGKSAENQVEIDKTILDLDGSENKSNFGANAILAVSMANLVALSKSSKKHIYELIPNIYGPPSLPVPFMNILNGGAHADNSVDIQEFMIVPHGFANFNDALRAGVEVYHTLKKRLKDKGLATNVGDEGGFAPNYGSSKEVLDEIMLAIAEAGYKPGNEISLALDAAASEFHQNNIYKIEGNSLTNIEMADYLIELSAAYPIVSIEDGLAEDDWEGWKYLTSKIGDRTQLVGDDLFVTQEKILQKGINDKCANSILIKVNQVGSISETIETMQLAKENNYTSMVSHRSGETEDAFISHLVVGTSSGQIKTGAPARGERTAKYNELLRISEQVGSENFDNQKWQK
ncbi:phosphopyruvate hydratase [Acidimicrobiaceae bacterium]|nr:phosphopyruvate hydratase [Acidimicrobiaceae bacterium]